ncbi:phasin family protein [Halobacillus litoralis]|uniref:Polyhydroxyalkanoate synthesis regulator n=1 Tax=Halobacillus litoralis TaxID=45668 RepID=A0A410MEX7_9BACI|nr:hypothetical protein [Halobacillus litoralis]QAS53250.1 hypothetical protein HLI_14145 [Halobacillus litoralis]
MSDLLKKGFHLGLGAALSGKEMFEKMVNEMVKRGEISPSQAKSMVNNWITKGETKDKEWNHQAKAKMQDQMKELGFVSKEDYEKLEARVQKLESLHERP